MTHSPRKLVSLAGHTSLKVGGPADWYSEPGDLEALRADLAFAAHHDLPLKVIGGGSNLLIADSGIEGLVLRPRMQDQRVEIRGDEAIIRAAAGASLGGIARALARQGWSGLEWAATVPGCVGGAVVNNAGAFGSSISACLLSATLLMNGEVRELPVGDLRYEYRTSVLKRGLLGSAIVLAASFALRKSSPSVTLRSIHEFQAQRTATQPRILSAGSVFANPPGDYSGRLLEMAGAKGMRRGDAEISTQHANFIVNHGSASASEVFELMVAARTLVWQTFRVRLDVEIELAGRWTDTERARLTGEPMQS